MRQLAISPLLLTTRPLTKVNTKPLSVLPKQGGKQDKSGSLPLVRGELRWGFNIFARVLKNLILVRPLNRLKNWTEAFGSHLKTIQWGICIPAALTSLVTAVAAALNVKRDFNIAILT